MAELIKEFEEESGVKVTPDLHLDELSGCGRLVAAKELLNNESGTILVIDCHVLCDFS